MRISPLISVCILLTVSCEQKTSTSTSRTEVTPMKITYLKKVNDDLISFCSCGDGRVTFPAQMDCPWCGCGWLFSCITCRKAFTFAEGVEIETSWPDLARDDIRNHWNEEPSEEDVDSWVEAMKEILAEVRVGEHYVIVDGLVIPVDSSELKFEGWAARHDFKELPQIRALADKAVLEERLANREYWLANALSEEE